MSIKSISRFSRAVSSCIEFFYRRLVRYFGCRRRVVFCLLHRNHYSMVGSLCELLELDPGYEFYFFVRAEGAEYDAVLDSLVSEGVCLSKVVSGASYYLARWDAHFDFDYSSFRIFRTSIFIQIFHGNAGKSTRSGGNYSLHKAISNYDYLFCLSEAHAELLKSNLRLKRPDSTRVVGFIKLDDVVNGRYCRDKTAASYGVPLDRPVALYLPSYNDGLSLESCGAGICKALISSGCVVITKLHPNSYAAQCTVSGFDGSWEEYFDSLHDGVDFFHIKDQVPARYFSVSDFLVSDFGSSPTEFMLTDRPVFFFMGGSTEALIADPDARLKLAKAAFCFVNPSSLADVLQRYLAAPEMRPEMLLARSFILKDRFYQPGSAAVRALNHLSDILR